MQFTLPHSYFHLTFSHSHVHIFYSFFPLISHYKFRANSIQIATNTEALHHTLILYIEKTKSYPS
jgi:hypothetical protein